jgi:signal transduction histidine kinase
VSLSSLRLRLLLLAAVTIGVTLGVGGLTLRLIFERHVERRVADELQVRWDELAGAFAVAPDGTPQLSQNLSDPRYARPLSGAYWQIADSTGVRLRSRSLWDETLAQGMDASHDPEPEAVERDGPNDSEIYVVERDVVRDVGSGRQRFRLSVALDHAEINAARDSFVADTAIALFAFGVVLLIGAGAQAAIGLRPLTNLLSQVAAIQSGRSTRLNGRFPDEVAPLASSLNLLLERQEVEVSKARERAGDLAHGLKTPLTVLAAEARRLEESGATDHAAVLREQVAYMRSHVERELTRARTRGTAVAGGTATEAATTAGKLIDLLRRVGRGADLVWVLDVPQALRIRMDPLDFGEVLGNLLDNARKHARSTVQARANLRGTATTITIVDDGPGIAEDERARLVRRGEQGQPDLEGSGLGLAIVTGVLGSYGLDLELTTLEHGGCAASFVVEGWIEPATPSPKFSLVAHEHEPVLT